MESLFETVTTLISIKEQSIKEGFSSFLPELFGPKQALNKPETAQILNTGTPKKLNLFNYITLLLWITHSKVVNLLTLCATKSLWAVRIRLNGGKIAEEANVLVNPKNTVHNKGAYLMGKRELFSDRSSLNSVCLNKISQPFLKGRAISTRILSLKNNKKDSRYETLLISNIPSI